jgi:hypothetical protein
MPLVIDAFAVFSLDPPWHLAVLRRKLQFFYENENPN